MANPSYTRLYIQSGRAEKDKAVIISAEVDSKHSSKLKSDGLVENVRGAAFQGYRPHPTTVIKGGLMEDDRGVTQLQFTKNKTTLRPNTTEKLMYTGLEVKDSKKFLGVQTEMVTSKQPVPSEYTGGGGSLGTLMDLSSNNSFFLHKREVISDKKPAPYFEQVKVPNDDNSTIMETVSKNPGVTLDKRFVEYTQHDMSLIRSELNDGSLAGLALGTIKGVVSADGLTEYPIGERAALELLPVESLEAVGTRLKYSDTSWFEGNNAAYFELKYPCNDILSYAKNTWDCSWLDN